MATALWTLHTLQKVGTLVAEGCAAILLIDKKMLQPLLSQPTAQCIEDPEKIELHEDEVFCLKTDDENVFRCTLPVEDEDQRFDINIKTEKITKVHS